MAPVLNPDLHSHLDFAKHFVRTTSCCASSEQLACHSSKWHLVLVVEVYFRTSNNRASAEVNPGPQQYLFVALVNS